MTKSYKRREKLIRPNFQFRLAGSIVGLAALALALQFLLLGYRMNEILASVDVPDEDLTRHLPGLLLQVIGFSVGVMLPIIFMLGIILTFRIAGPVHRFETYLKSVIDGEHTGPCSIRNGDQLQDLCGLINGALDATRERALAGEETSDTESSEKVDELRAAG